jgi:hypothetical protein
MIFLSPQKVSQLLDLIEKNKTMNSISLMALDDQINERCIPMGEGCFHPQLGYIDKKLNDVKSDSSKKEAPKDPGLQLKTFNAVETSMINCDHGNYFDIYCGKEKANTIPADNIEIWFDISSSLRTVDYNKDPNHCNRRTFMTKVMEGCKDKVRVSVYNTALKEMGDFSSVCMAYGTNDDAKLLQWMKNSSAKTLLIVTDIDQISRSMRDFLEERGAKIIGDGVKAFSSTDLINYANDLIKTCKK